MAFIAGLVKKEISLFQNGKIESLVVMLSPPDMEWRKAFYDAMEKKEKAQQEKAINKICSPERIAPFFKEWNAVDCEGGAVPCTPEVIEQSCKLNEELHAGLTTALIESISFLVRKNSKPSDVSTSTSGGTTPEKPASKKAG